MIHYRLHRDPKSSHQQIVRLVRRIGRDPILDVGAAQGILGHLLKDVGCTIDAIEPNPEWAECARPYYRNVFVTAVEAAPLSRNTYQVVVCADVLEHTVDPAAVLRTLRSAATGDAFFIISVPNVAHLAVRLLLLFGRFPRMERGILDRTHLQFYTRDTAQDMLHSAGLQIARISATGIPLDELWPDGEDRLLFKLLTGMQHLALVLAPRLFGYQWIFVARQHPNGSAPG